MSTSSPAPVLNRAQKPPSTPNTHISTSTSSYKSDTLSSTHSSREVLKNTNHKIKPSKPTTTTVVFHKGKHTSRTAEFGGAGGLATANGTLPSTRHKRSGSDDDTASLGTTATISSISSSSTTTTGKYSHHAAASAGSIPSIESPVPAMRWTRITPMGNVPPRPVRAHTMTLVGEKLYLFGGCDNSECFPDLWIFDSETMSWSKPITRGTLPDPTRAHSASLIEKKLYMFGGGDGPNYYNSLYVLDTTTLTWTKPIISGGSPGPRRAHTTWVYDNRLYVYAGGDGVRALNDVYVLDPAASTPAWSKLATTGRSPVPRGYHTSTLVGSTVVVYGGSDGHECFSDIHLLDLGTSSNTWRQVDTDRPIPRLSHTATQVGSYLFVMGGHDGVRYSSEILLLNLVTLGWETRKILGGPPKGRGYHTAVMHDSRLFVFGGYDGESVFSDMWILDLGAFAYLPQITSFQVGMSP
ncbi:hypothetical protein SmJEL517_g06030 [Synchytrium microbalum]|uniref:Galactose oxidase n=1 Tax=Synchytrium microbalum TaxID=1806994 RepID=A0A507BRQ2_9FUNG|nr:uncharacterized protein SmJEL517_g06030 [Synchytrium microbalum]TPX30402.1 hypothetical protein SmJEL517_g06030 [Synchytrium microbalum]